MNEIPEIDKRFSLERKNKSKEIKEIRKEMYADRLKGILDCPSEEQLIRMKLSELTGVQALNFDMANRKLEFSF